MFGSAILEVAIGVVFSFLLLSLVATALNEGVSSLVGLRAWTLERGLKKLLAEPEGKQLVRMLYAHPMVTSLAHPSLAQRLVSKLTRRPVDSRPPYIPAHTFSMVLMETVVNAVIPDAPGGRPTSLVEVGNAVALLPEPYDNVKRSLLTMIDEADGDVKQARGNIEQWFNDAMQRVSGWYKRTAQAITVTIALAMCSALNADTLMIADQLYRNSMMRGALVAAATESVRLSPNPNDAFNTLTGVIESMNANNAIQVPLGWVTIEDGVIVTPAISARMLPTDLKGWVTKGIGFVISVIAISLGAPFWFSVLNGMVRLRLDGEPPKRNP
jgi:hypothetical protein